MQDHFDWRSLAVAAITAPIAQAVGKGVDDLFAVQGNAFNFGSRLTSNFVNGVIAQEVRIKVYHQGKMDYDSIAADAFGNALGSAIMEKMKTPSGEQKLKDEQAAKQKSLEADVIRLKDKYKLSDPTDLVNDPEKQKLVEKLVQMNGGDRADAEAKAQLLDTKRTTDEINALRKGMSVDNEDYSTLSKISKLYTAMLMNTDIYSKGTVPEILPSGVSRMDDAALSTAGVTLRNKDFVDDKSGYFGALYSDSNFSVDGKSAYTYVNRGTDFKTLSDWLNNLEQGFGMLSQQYDKAITIGRGLYRELGDNLQFSGHSLGGGLAAAQILATGAKGMSFNAAGVSAGTISRYDLKEAFAGNIAAFNVNGEALSRLQDNYLVDAAAAVYGTETKNLLAAAGVMADLVHGNKPDFASFGIGYVAEAAGNRTTLPAVDLQGNSLNMFQRFTNTVDLHGMMYVTRSANVLFNNGQLNNTYLSHVAY